MNYVGWIESDGNQWIDMEVEATQDIGFEVDFLTKSAVATSGFGMILGCMKSASNRYGVGTYPDKTGGGLFYGSAVYDPAITSGERMTISLLNGVLTTPAGTTNVSATTFSAGVSIALFGRKKSDGTVDELSKTRAFSCRVYENGTLIRDCWPCCDPDGVACMYDRVQKKYRYNQGSGAFGTPEAEPDSGVEVGTTWVYTSNTTFTVPADGKYQVELHGGGGGGAGVFDGNAGIWYCAGGGGSGHLLELTLTKDESYAITVGAGGSKGTAYSAGAAGSSGGRTTFGNQAVNGGGGGAVDMYFGRTPGGASGNIATDGSTGTGYAAGGKGNKNNTAQTYGDGGASNTDGGINGQPGTVIITYLGA